MGRGLGREMDHLAVTDASLVARVRRGDADAATELYNRYAKRVFGLVSKQMADYLRTQVEPEDIVQSVFRSVFRGVGQAGYDAPAGGTLWQLIAVLAVHKVRKNARKQSASKRNNRHTASLDDLAELQANVGSPQEFEAAVREAVEGLSEVQRAVVRLRVQAYTVEEIAEKIGKSRRTTERLLQSAREELAEMLIAVD